MDCQQLRTDRLLLRRWRDEDRKPFAAICADPDVMRYIGDGSTRTAEQASRAIDYFEQEWEEKGYGLFAVELRQTAEFIGFTGLIHPYFMPEVLPSVEIGWRLAKAHWGKGYASEAAAEALSFALRTPTIEEIVSICQSGNDASVRIMQKIGLTFDRRTVDPTHGKEVQVYRLAR